jgi:hypothetical protein
MSFKINASHKFATQNTPVDKSKSAEPSALSTDDYLLYNLDSSSAGAKQGAAKKSFKSMKGACIRPTSSAQPDFY